MTLLDRPGPYNPGSITRDGYVAGPIGDDGCQTIVIAGLGHITRDAIEDARRWGWEIGQRPAWLPASEPPEGFVDVWRGGGPNVISPHASEFNV